MKIGTVEDVEACQVTSYSDSFQLLFVGGSKGKLSIIDTRQQKLLDSFTAHTQSIKSLSIQGHYLFSCSKGGEIKLWDMSTLGSKSSTVGKVLGIHEFGSDKAGALHLGPQRNVEMKVVEDRVYSSHEGTFMIW
jgi:WD40 repeat protein